MTNWAASSNTKNKRSNGYCKTRPRIRPSWTDIVKHRRLRSLSAGHTSCDTVQSEVGCPAILWELSQPPHPATFLNKKNHAEAWFFYQRLCVLVFLQSERPEDSCASLDGYSHRVASYSEHIVGDRLWRIGRARELLAVDRFGKRNMRSQTIDC